MLDFRQHRKVPDRLTDVLPWAALVDDGVVLNKDGSFLSVIEYRGPDLDSSTDDELTIKSHQLNEILRRYSSGWAFFTEARRESVDEYPESLFPEPVSALIDVHRQVSFRANPRFESRYFLSLQYLPPRETTTKLASLFFANKHTEGINYDKILSDYRTETERTLKLLERIYPYVARLEGDELLTYLHSTISTKAHVVRVPENPMYLDAVLADTPFLGGSFPKLGDKHLCVVGLLGFPTMSKPGILDIVNHLPIEYRWVSRFISLDKIHAKKLLESFQRKWFAKRKSVVSVVKELLLKEESINTDSEAVQKAEDATNALLSLGTDGLSFGYFTGTFVLKHSNEAVLRSLVSELEKAINGAGFVSKIETINAVDAWLGTIPGNPRNNVRQPILHSWNLAHLFPGASAVWSGTKWNKHLNAPALLVADTSGSTPFRLSTHVGDVGHTLILGPTGSGKSTLLGVMEAQFLRYPNAKVYIFDKGQSALPLTTAVGGDFYNLGADDNGLSFQPLAQVDDELDRQWAHDWLCGIAEKENVVVTPEIKRAIWNALVSIASSPERQRTLHALTVFIQDKTLRAVFEPYTQSGPYGRILDNDTESLSSGTWQCFEMEKIMETPAIVAPVLSYLFHRLDQCFDGSPTLLVLDEAWLFLDHPAFASKIREWLKTLRKKNVSVIFATQSLSDVETSPISPTLKEACFTKLFLPNSVALQPDASRFYTNFGLNERQIEILAYAIQKRDYYYTSPEGNRLFELNLDPLTLAYCSGASKERSQLVLELRKAAKSTAEFNVLFLRKLGFQTEITDIFQSTIAREAA